MLADTRRDLVIAFIAAGSVERYVAFTSEGGEIAVLSELRPRTLLDLWHGRRTR